MYSHYINKYSYTNEVISSSSPLPRSTIFPVSAVSRQGGCHLGGAVDQLFARPKCDVTENPIFGLF